MPGCGSPPSGPPTTSCPEEDIRSLAVYVPQALAQVPVLVVAFSDQGIPVGFMGIDGTRLEMLFLSPDVPGDRSGPAACSSRGIRRYGVTSLCVNEREPSSPRFLFSTWVFRSAAARRQTKQGNPFPLPLHVPAGIGASLAPFFPPCYTEGSTIMERRYPAMINTTLCYIRQGGQCLMLHRVKKENEILNQGKWIGIGGKFEDGGRAPRLHVQEVNEETGLTPAEYRYQGLVTFVSDRWPTGTCMYSPSTALPDPEGRLPGGDLEWLPGHSCAPSPTEGGGTRSF